MGLVDTIRAKYATYKLEQKYTQREKRTTFHSTAQYVNGEYVYTSNGAKRQSFSYSRGLKRSPSVNISEIFSRRSTKS